MNKAAQFLLVTAAIIILGLGVYVIATKSKDTPKTVTPTPSNTVSRAQELAVKISDQIRGNKEASITVVEYADFQCPYCVTFDKTMKQVVEAYPTQVRWIYRHYPLSYHQAARGSAIGSEAAGLQGKFWEFTDLLVANSKANGDGLAEADLLKYATDLGLDIEKFKSDLANPALAKKVDADTQSGTDVAISSTPSSFLIGQNGSIEDLTGALTLDQMKAKIDLLLK